MAIIINKILVCDKSAGHLLFSLNVFVATDNHKTNNFGNKNQVRQYENSKMDEDMLAIIIDNGTDKIKSGFAGGNPRGVFSTVIGTPKYGDGKHYIGDEAQTVLTRRMKISK